MVLFSKNEEKPMGCLVGGLAFWLALILLGLFWEARKINQPEELKQSSLDEVDMEFRSFCQQEAQRREKDNKRRDMQTKSGDTSRAVC